MAAVTNTHSGLSKVHLERLQLRRIKLGKKSNHRKFHAQSIKFTADWKIISYAARELCKEESLTEH